MQDLYVAVSVALAFTRLAQCAKKKMQKEAKKKRTPDLNRSLSLLNSTSCASRHMHMKTTRKTTQWYVPLDYHMQMCRCVDVLPLGRFCELCTIFPQRNICTSPKIVVAIVVGVFWVNGT
jgi:hypothetical protein